VLVVDLICLKYATQGETQIREISTPSILTYKREVCMMARKITRRGLIGLGLSLGAVATLYPFLRWGYEITQPLRHAAPRGVWFEKIGEAPSDGEVELRFVDEAGNPAEFSALLFWEPTGEAEEIYIRGRLRLPKRELAHRVDKWKEFLSGRGEPPKTENTLLTILPISTPGEALPYTVLLENPRFTNRTYVVRGRQKRRAAGTSFTACPDFKLVSDSYVDITNWVPAVGLIDQSSKAFGDADVTFHYNVDGVALRLNAYGVVSLQYGTSARISSIYSWSTGTLWKQEGRKFTITSDDQSASIVFYNTILRVSVIEEYEGCLIKEVKIAVNPIHIETTQTLNALDYVPAGALDAAEPVQYLGFLGKDGRGRDGNLISLIQFLENEPLLDVGGRVGIGLPVGSYLKRVLGPYASVAEKLYVALNFQVYGGVALYSASVATDAPPWVRYGAYIHRAQLIHYLKDYAFKPLNTIVRLTD
jgi:hypothetical protein